MLFMEKNIFNEVPFSTFEIDVRGSNGSIGIISGWSKQATEIYGYEESEVLGESIEILMPRSFYNEDYKIFLRVKEGEQVKNFETICLKKDGMPIVVNMFLYPISDIRNKQVVSIYGYIDDITSYFGFKRFFEEIVNSQENIKNSVSSLKGALESSISYDNAKLYLGRKKRPSNLVETIITALEFFDYYTFGHSDRVTKYALLIGRRMQLSPLEIELLKIAAPIHDIGKLGVPYAILNKNGRLSDDEMVQMKNHSDNGARMLNMLGFDEPLVKAVRWHHERYDGKGYPDGLKAEEIPLLARILCLADSYDAMTSDRPYKKKMSVDDAREEVKKCAGTQFCPSIVSSFVSSI